MYLDFFALLTERNTCTMDGASRIKSVPPCLLPTLFALLLRLLQVCLVTAAHTGTTAAKFVNVFSSFCPHYSTIESGGLESHQSYTTTLHTVSQQGDQLHTVLLYTLYSLW